MTRALSMVDAQLFDPASLFWSSNEGQQRRLDEGSDYSGLYGAVSAVFPVVTMVVLRGAKSKHQSYRGIGSHRCMLASEKLNPMALISNNQHENAIVHVSFKEKPQTWKIAQIGPREMERRANWRSLAGMISSCLRRPCGVLTVARFI